ncbi:hypothetical protein TNCV_2846611 [Trichonephila clavipes]|nr:hypothetical protein TNCV_2846611 [Trichonephila clavipes]
MAPQALNCYSHLFWCIEDVDVIRNKIACPSNRSDFLELFEEMDLVPKMPEFLDKQAQLSIEAANETRLVISIRWVVEAVNSQHKKWRTLNNIIPNTIYWRLC